MKRINVNLPVSLNRSYPIFIGTGTLKSIATPVRSLTATDCILIISDTNVTKKYRTLIETNLTRSKFTDYAWYVIPAGEKTKNLDTVNKIVTYLSASTQWQKKKVCILALGGGVVGDIAGFVAGIYRRGIDYVQVPTTLLAMVDSAIGGKVGVDLPDGKNLVGLFYQPKFVLIDLAVLQTLPQIELVTGLAEVVKYGVIADPKLFTFLETNFSKILNRDIKCLTRIIDKSVRIKASIVGQDEFDTKDVRINLNFGHTFAHAIESATAYRKYRHGQAVSIGMICAANLAVRLGMIPVNVRDRIVNLLHNLTLPTSLPGGLGKEILRTMQRDKKFVHGKSRFVLPTCIGQVKVIETVPPELISSLIRSR